MNRFFTYIGYTIVLSLLGLSTNYTVYGFEESYVVERFGERIAEGLDDETDLDRVLGVIQHLHNKYESDNHKQEVLFIARQSIVNAFFYDKSQKQLREFYAMQNELLDSLKTQGKEYISIFLSLGGTNDRFLGIKRGDDCVSEYNDYLGRDIITCDTYLYTIENTEGMIRDLGVYPTKLEHIVYNSKKETVAQRLNGVPLSDTLPLRISLLPSFSDFIDSGLDSSESISPFSLGLVDSQGENMGFADLHYMPLSQKIVIVPRYRQVDNIEVFTMKEISL